jgi:sulfhydrogenase subunit beta (sulfur reductase)
VTTRVIARDGLDQLLSSLVEDGYTLIGPRVRDQAIVYDRIESTADLPEGVTDEQEGGHYRLVERGDHALFGYNLGPVSWKRYLHPPEVELVRIHRSEDGLGFVDTRLEPPRFAFVGVRACELAAIAVQDRVFIGAGGGDPTYAERRRDLFVVAVNCGGAGATCFCSSMGTGPRCTSGYDIVVTEILSGDEDSSYVLQAGSDRGGRVLTGLGGREPTPADFDHIDAAIAQAESEMGRHMDIAGIRDLLVGNPEHPRWHEVADRCLTCGNCTMACPTCFCSTMTDTVALDGEAVRARRWDSCFGLEFSGLHGHPVRSSARSRYRQWMTHKLATWYDQFGVSGCVGCGRCITWCPVGIDITEEVAAMRGAIPV